MLKKGGPLEGGQMLQEAEEQVGEEEEAEVERSWKVVRLGDPRAPRGKKLSQNKHFESTHLIRYQVLHEISYFSVFQFAHTFGSLGATSYSI